MLSYIDRFNLRKNPALIFFATFLFICFAYRIIFIFRLDGSFDASIRDQILMGAFQDVLVSFVFSVFLWQCYFFYNALNLKDSILKRGFDFLGWMVIYVFLFLSAMIFASNQETFLRLHTVLSYSLIISAVKGFTFVSFFSQVTFFQWVYLLSPLFIFFSFYRLRKTNLAFYATIVMLLSIVITVILNWHAFMRQIDQFQFIGNAETYPYRLKTNPYQTIFFELMETPKNQYMSMNEEVSELQEKSIALIDPAFVLPKTRKPLVSISSDKKDWNVVLIILESTAMDYVFDQEYAGKMPMPYLKQLADNGVVFENNYSTGNSSIQGIFSILSGDYPYFNRGMFELSKDNVVPSLVKNLNDRYTTFMVHPSMQGHYMPSDFVRTSQIPLYEKEDLPENHLPKLEMSWFVNENDGIDFFINKIKQASTPFFGIYFSGAAHYPYYDYGKQWQIAKNLDLEIDRYYNNLFMLDAQIKRVVSSLSEAGALDNTIIVVLGDHGEGFGQHPDNWKHTTSLHKQQVHVPVVLYQPALFSPQRVTSLTSSIELMPTLMDILGAPYDKSHVQGESWIKSVPEQRYVFMAGSRGQRFSSIDVTTNLKLMLDVHEATCEVYDLVVDAAEQHPLTCEAQMKQLEDLVRFSHFQQKAMLTYNSELLKKMF